MKKDIKPFEKKVWLSSPTMHGDEIKYVEEAYNTNWMSTVGANINEVEKNICNKVGCKYAVALSSGTAALHLAMKLAGIKTGEKVFCSDMTFSATVNPIIYEGGIPVFIDTEYDSWNMDPVALEKAFELYPEVRIIVVAHLYGTPGKIDEIFAIAKKHNATIIEDAAESLGATYKGKQTGTFGKYGIFSFNGNKIITTSGGGMLVSDDEERIQKVRFWATQSRDKARYYQHSEIGYNYRMSNIVAGIGRGQLKVLNDRLAKKKEIYETYKEAFKDIQEIEMKPVPADTKPNYWLSTMLLKEGSKVTPLNVMEALDKENIESRPIWKPMHIQPVFEKFDFIKVEEKPISEDIFARGVCLPSDTKMTKEEQQEVIRIIKELF